MNLTKAQAIAELEIAEGNLKVMILQDSMNDMLAQHLGTRIMYNRVRPHIGEFCDWVLAHERLEEFGNLTVKDLLRAWGPIAEVKPKDLKEAIERMNEQIDIFKVENKGLLDA